MFCINCGRKLNPGAARCPKCGGEPAPADYCGGFWKLTETRAPAPQAAAAVGADPAAAAADEALILQQQELLAEAQRQIMEGKRRERTLRMAAVMLGAALLVMVIALIFALASGRGGKEAPEPENTPKIVETEQALPTTQPEPTATQNANGSTEKTDAEGETEKTEQPEESAPVSGPHGQNKPTPTPASSSAPTPTPPAGNQAGPDGAN